MPLLDHFHPPLSDERSWEGFHGEWAGMIVRHLNDGVLPERFFAEPRIHWGSVAEIDVATIERVAAPASDSHGGTATAVWAPPAPSLTLSIDALDPDIAEVQIIRMRGGRRLVAAIELVSPRNKDRPASRRTFAVKCAAYLQSGVSLAVVDIVSDRHARLHSELLELLGARNDGPHEPGLAASSYRSTPAGGGAGQIEIWHEPLSIGEPLPTLPLWLDEEFAVPLELEAGYESTCRALRIDV